MLNQAAVEALYSATYVENYLDCVENLPDDLQRHLSRMRELDVTYQGTCLTGFALVFISILSENWQFFQDQEFRMKLPKH
jgi:hypothetical protein